MKHNRSFVLIALLLALGAQQAAAQRGGAIAQRAASPAQRRGYLGFSYDPITIRLAGQPRAAVEVVDVVRNSPAEQAGLQVGDTIVSINDIRVSEEFLSSLGTTLAPGDAVRLRVRRAGRDRDLNVEAAPRPADYDTPPDFNRSWSFEVSPDSIRRRMRIYLDSARISLDSLHLPRLRVERLPGGGSVYMYSDTGRVKFFPMDSTLFRRDGGGFWMFPPDSAFRFRSDSLLLRALPGKGFFSFDGDSLMRMRFDTLRMKLGELPRGRIYGLNGDSLFQFQPGPDRGFGVGILGMRAVGGAELTDLNPDLGEYFGADQGVLVVRVPNGTPAEHAGLEAGDVIVSANGRDVSSVAELRRAIASASSRANIRLEIIRKKAHRTIDLRQD